MATDPRSYGIPVGVSPPAPSSPHWMGHRFRRIFQQVCPSEAFAQQTTDMGDRADRSMMLPLSTSLHHPDRCPQQENPLTHHLTHTSFNPHIGW